MDQIILLCSEDRAVKPILVTERMDIATKHKIFRVSDKTSSACVGQGGHAAVTNKPLHSVASHIRKVFPAHVTAHCLYLVGGFHVVMQGPRLPLGLGSSASRQHLRKRLGAVGDGLGYARKCCGSLLPRFPKSGTCHPDCHGGQEG